MKENLCVSCRNGQTNEELLCGICYNSWFNSCLKEELPKSVCISKSQELLAALERRQENPEVNNDALNTLLDSINVLQCLEWLLTSPDHVSLSMKEYLYSVLSALLEKSNFSGQLFHRLVVYEHISTLIARKDNKFLQKVLLQTDDLWSDIQKYRKRQKNRSHLSKTLKAVKTGVVGATDYGIGLDGWWFCAVCGRKNPGTLPCTFGSFAGRFGCVSVDNKVY